MSMTPSRHNAPYRFGSSRWNSGAPFTESPARSWSTVHVLHESNAPMILVTNSLFALTMLSANNRFGTIH